METWLSSAKVQERLAQRNALKSARAHKGLKIALSGCPNGCARHQVADLAVVGMMAPLFNEEACIACGVCVPECPDRALDLKNNRLIRQDHKCQGCFTCSGICPEEAFKPAIRQVGILAGGRLGRHPAWAREVARIESPEKAMQVISDLFEKFLSTSEPAARFGHWFQEQGKGGA